METGAAARGSDQHHQQRSRPLRKNLMINHEKSHEKSSEISHILIC